ncbi:MarR family winged helix-turn-helix transcriptional regulator [Actinocatenispora thailandica]|uniref:MarR family winged helix-turn-helix transcriptional regulator n=1 Tax=Actinocatenispora thailandica TaxID=227318 RepID=UPI00194F2741|nr:MarR family winged helix-turn-helix transcriptional regulator [Actinocatenispora thailandica]
MTDVQAVDHVMLTEQPIGPVQLGDRLGIRSASATALVDRLVAADHVQREPDPHDGRRVTLAVTDHARREVGAALRPLIEQIVLITDQLDDDQRTTVRTVLDQIATAMRDYATGAEPGRPGAGDSNREHEAPRGATPPVAD